MSGEKQEVPWVSFGSFTATCGCGIGRVYLRRIRVLGRTDLLCESCSEAIVKFNASGAAVHVKTEGDER